MNFLLIQFKSSKLASNMSSTKFTIKFTGGASKDVDIKEIKDISSIRFKPNEAANDSYDILNFCKSFYNFEDCISVCTSSLEIKKEIKDKQIVKRLIKTASGGTHQYVLVYKLGSFTGDNKFVMSSNRFIAICSATITIGLFGTIFDWESRSNKPVGETTKKAYNQVTTGDAINRLAEKIGISKQSRLYWLYLPGVENCFEIFPEEVTTICCWRVLHKEKSGLSGDAVSSIKALSNKFVKRGISIGDLNQGKIMEYYKELERCVHTSASHQHAVDFMLSVTSMFNKHAEDYIDAKDLKSTKASSSRMP
ncbi:putative nucleocapsid protein [Karaka Okahu purepure emaravirus]|uniref:Nucleocapsid protein n=1 Tax=Karaka Okahu purepure emaravirus TaxID=2872811 RepID=A0AAX1PBY9_9VIRU|nr:putative nucleocapsid protein [Karaka Okahu purepure emaravirus]QZN83755.1 putative nucleocapsid protein [Karaka Okahu purepure emaravirus]